MSWRHQQLQREHSLWDWERKLESCGWKCFWCSRPLTSHTATKDHLQPVSRGGRDTIDNIVPACRHCNSMKGNMTGEEFKAVIESRFSTICGKNRTGVFLYRQTGFKSELEQAIAERDNHSETMRLRRESETTSSWAWKNPPRSPEQS